MGILIFLKSTENIIDGFYISNIFILIRIKMYVQVRNKYYVVHRNGNGDYYYSRKGKRIIIDRKRVKQGSKPSYKKSRKPKTQRLSKKRSPKRTPRRSRSGKRGRPCKNGRDLITGKCNPTARMLSMLSKKGSRKAGRPCKNGRDPVTGKCNPILMPMRKSRKCKYGRSRKTKKCFPYKCKHGRSRRTEKCKPQYKCKYGRSRITGKCNPAPMRKSRKIIEYVVPGIPSGIEKIGEDSIDSIDIDEVIFDDPSKKKSGPRLSQRKSTPFEPRQPNPRPASAPYIKKMKNLRPQILHLLDNILQRKGITYEKSVISMLMISAMNMAKNLLSSFNVKGMRASLIIDAAVKNGNLGRRLGEVMKRALDGRYRYFVFGLEIMRPLYDYYFQDTIKYLNDAPLIVIGAFLNETLIEVMEAGMDAAKINGSTVLTVKYIRLGVNADEELFALVHELDGKMI